jgi:hypothetical protein
MMLKRAKQLRALKSALMALALTSCATVPKVTNLSPAHLYLTPSTSSYQDPEATLSDYRTFSVFPASLISEDAKTNEIMEKQLLFFLRNCLEAKGYRFVPLDQNPDFLATITVSSEYKESYVPPSTGVLPVWVPGHTITSYGNTSGTFNYNTYRSYSSYGWGSYSGTISSTTYVPGYMTIQTYTRPGYTVGHYYPVAAVSIFDAKSLKNVWLGTGAGTSANPDARVSGQFVVTSILNKFPNSALQTEAASIGVLGMQLFVFTNDGNNYFPTVFSVVSGGPAARAGIKPYDMILSIDGVQLVNKPFSDVIQLLEGDPKAPLTLKLWRTRRQLTVNVTRLQRDPVKR